MSYSCKILSIDGGGIRGVIPATFLNKIDLAVPGHLLQYFDVVCGTSAGGLIALALTTPQTSNGKATYPLTTTAIMGLFLNDYAKIFDPQNTGWAKYWSPAYWIYQTLGSASTSLSKAQSSLQSLFSGGKIPRQVAVTSYAIAPDTAPYLFGWQAAASSSADNYYVWEAALATSAAPTYFPLAHVGGGATMGNLPPNTPALTGSSAKERWAVDGGVVANDPVVFALAQAAAAGCDISNPLIVSLGTGSYDGIVKVPQNSYDAGNWGDAQWFTDFSFQTDVNGNPLSSPAIVGVLGSNPQAAEMQIRSLVPKGNYMRLDLGLSYGQSPLDGDDAAALQTLALDYVAPGGGGNQALLNIVAALQR